VLMRTLGLQCFRAENVSSKNGGFLNRGVA